MRSLLAGSGSTPTITSAKLASRKLKAVSLAADPMDRPIDGIEVHRGVHRWQLCPVLLVQRDGLVAQIGEEVGLPIPLQALRVKRIEK